MTHTSSVLGVALLLWLAGPALQERISVGFSLLSGVLVALLGACLLVARWRGQWRRGGSHAAATVDNERRAIEPESRMPGPSVVGLLTLGISGGIVPCWDAVVLLLIATAQGQVGSAVLLLVSFSAGLASALVFVGVLAVKLRGFLSSRMGSGRLVKFLPVLSAATIMAVGLYLCFTTLQQPMSLSSLSLPAARGTAGP